MRRLVYIAWLMGFWVSVSAHAQSFPDEDQAQRDALIKSIETQAAGLSLGNTNGILQITEFFDYQCVFCRRMEPSIERLLTERPNLRLILKPWPIFGSESVYAARAIFGAAWQGRLRVAHAALLRIKGPLTSFETRYILRRSGVNLAELDHDLSNRRREIDESLTLIAKQAVDLGLHATPGLVVNGHIVPGALDYQDLVSLLDERPSRKK